MRGRIERQRGFALLIVLWTVAVLALLGTQLVAIARERSLLARNLRDVALLETATNGAVQHAIFAMLDQSGQHWRLDGSIHTVAVGPVFVAVRLDDEAGKINPNVASEDLLAALLSGIGADPLKAASLAAAIVDWRSPGAQALPLGAKAPRYAAAGLDYGPPGTGFARVDELDLVLGMTPELLERLRPHLTLFTDTDPDLTSRDPVVVMALRATTDGGSAAVSGAPAAVTTQIASVTAVARGPDNSTLTKRVIVRINAGGARRRYEIVASEQPAPG